MEKRKEMAYTVERKFLSCIRAEEALKQIIRKKAEKEEKPAQGGRL